ncbi:MAG: T9SS type A sorting domain-containing protein [Ignavibacteriales bacterium]|nr:T9SS type A sorting domain-containing protein [Ignavibacteriales bacterium]
MGNKWIGSESGLTVFNENGIISAVEQKDEPIIIPTNYVLYQNYPNSFNPSASIKYSIPKQSKVNLKVFDILGREIRTLVNKEQAQGNYELEFDGSKLTSGIYFYRLIAGDFVETKKDVIA